MYTAKARVFESHKSMTSHSHDVICWSVGAVIAIPPVGRGRSFTQQKVFAREHLRFNPSGKRILRAESPSAASRYASIPNSALYQQKFHGRSRERPLAGYTIATAWQSERRRALIPDPGLICYCCRSVPLTDRLRTLAINLRLPHKAT